MMKALGLITIALMLSGCGMALNAAASIKTCEARGLIAGTDRFNQCVDSEMLKPIWSKTSVTADR